MPAFTNDFAVINKDISKPSSIVYRLSKSDILSAFRIQGRCQLGRGHDQGNLGDYSS